ncbi:hypothetical protein [Nocardia seriolae]|uniref:hypothetical protein n=1 Tax=Nocardia seriolae TaxID=37332 RepID=UPI00131A1518|nr:hypothetical protein [Nocardia seriolae]
MNSDVANRIQEAMDALPDKITSGYLLDADGEAIANQFAKKTDWNLLESGDLDKSPSVEIGERLRQSPTKLLRGNAQARWRSDVEMKAAELMRSLVS